jgi:hypothetical protein
MKPSLPYIRPVERFEEPLQSDPDLPSITHPWRAVVIGVSLSLGLLWALYQVASWLWGMW